MPEQPFDTFGENLSPPLRSVAVTEYTNAFLIPDPPTNWTRAKQAFETVVIVPIAALMFGFLPELVAQSQLPFKRYFKFVPAKKPTSAAV